MESFRTEVPTTPAPFRLCHTDRLLLVGSCFTEHIGARLAAGKLNVLANPFGIVYNPSSILRCLERLWGTHPTFDETELFENAGLWRSWEHHGQFAQPDKTATLADINAACQRAADWLHDSNRLLLTFGTADVFALRDTGQVVANNHKMPAAHFTQHRLSVSEVVEGMVGILEKIKQKTPDFQVIVTVSPVRHLRSGAVANQRSKATLVLACEALCQRLPYVHYFPAYELLLDDLRDYRFYANDLIHPSELAVDYIWRAFCETYFSVETKTLLADISKLRSAVQHRPLHPASAEHRAFIETQRAAVTRMKQAWPLLDWSSEQTYFG